MTTDEFRSNIPRGYPVDYGDWPEAQQLEYFAANQYKVGAIREMLSLVNYSRDADDDAKYVRKKELGAVILYLEGYRQ